MRILPRSRGGRVLVGVAIVLVALDLMTVVGSLRIVDGNSGWLGNTSITFHSGCLHMRTSDSPFATRGARWARPHAREWLFSTRYWSVPGFMNWRETVLPLWHLWLPITCLAVFIERRHARQTRTPNACPHCNYDLTGLALDATCPECGKKRD